MAGGITHVNEILIRIMLAEMILTLQHHDVQIIRFLSPGAEGACAGPLCQLHLDFDQFETFAHHGGKALNEAIQIECGRLVKIAAEMVLGRCEGFPIVPFGLTPRQGANQSWVVSDPQTGLSMAMDSFYMALDNVVLCTLRMAYFVCTERHPKKVGETINIRRPIRFMGAKP